MINLRFRAYHPRLATVDYWILKRGIRVGLIEHSPCNDQTVVRWYVHSPLDTYDKVRVRAMRFSKFKDAWRALSNPGLIWYDHNGTEVKDD